MTGTTGTGSNGVKRESQVNGVAYPSANNAYVYPSYPGAYPASYGYSYTTTPVSTSTTTGVNNNGSPLVTSSTAMYAPTGNGLPFTTTPPNLFHHHPTNGNNCSLGHSLPPSAVYSTNGYGMTSNGNDDSSLQMSTPIATSDGATPSSNGGASTSTDHTTSHMNHSYDPSMYTTSTATVTSVVAPQMGSNTGLSDGSDPSSSSLMMHQQHHPMHTMSTSINSGDPSMLSTTSSITSEQSHQYSMTQQETSSTLSSSTVSST
jgi:hypothetical protein